jgi:hypothetical protein
MRWMGHVTCIRKERKVYKVLVEKLIGKRPLRRPRHTRKIGSERILGRLAGRCGMDSLGPE